MAHPRAERLTRARIVEAAHQLSAGGRLKTLSMRGLAASMGVTPMALYRHVADKDDLMLAMTDERLRQQELPSDEVPWDVYLRGLAMLLWALLRSEPAVLGVFARRPVIVAAVQARLDAAVMVLTRDGFSEERAVRAYATVHTYTVGFCSLEAGRKHGRVVTEVGDLDTRAGQIAEFVTETQFEHGLDAIIEGLRRERPDRSTAAASD